MAQCVKCGNSGLFLKVNASGLCSKCAEEQKKLDARIREIEEEIEKSPN